MGTTAGVGVDGKTGVAGGSDLGVGVGAGGVGLGAATGVAVGIATGVGTSVGTAVGTVAVTGTGGAVAKRSVGQRLRSNTRGGAWVAAGGAVGVGTRTGVAVATGVGSASTEGSRSTGGAVASGAASQPAIPTSTTRARPSTALFNSLVLQPQIVLGRMELHQEEGEVRWWQRTETKCWKWPGGPGALREFMGV